MDALYFLRHSRSADLEIRYSLRALARHLPGVRKVWGSERGSERGRSSFLGAE